MSFGGVNLKIPYSYRKIEVSEKPIFIIGLSPGRQRLKERNYEVFHGNQSGDLIEEIIKDKVNILLTNIFNYYVDEITSDLINEGLLNVLKLIKIHKPYKVICLGNFSFQHVSKLIKDEDLDIELTKLQHPSFIIRFKKDRKQYINMFKEQL